MAISCARSNSQLAPDPPDADNDISGVYQGLTEHEPCDRAEVNRLCDFKFEELKSDEFDVYKKKISGLLSRKEKDLDESSRDALQRRLKELEAWETNAENDATGKN